MGKLEGRCRGLGGGLFRICFAMGTGDGEFRSASGLGVLFVLLGWVLTCRRLILYVDVACGFWKYWPSVVRVQGPKFPLTPTRR